jgi:glucan biosynthesis protein C
VRSRPRRPAVSTARPALATEPPGEPATEATPARLHYLDWLRVIAILGVFLFHAVHPFDLMPWHIKNAERSQAVTFFIAFMFPWGMPFFFFLAGAGSLFALRRRSPRAFVRERSLRLLLPYLGGALCLMPPMLYFEWLHKTQTGLVHATFLSFVLGRRFGFSPVWFGVLGYHLWFLGFLFSFSLLALPVFAWLGRAPGRRVLASLGAVAGRPGALLVFALPLAAVRLALHPLSPQEHGWADFFVQMAFFVLGYVLFADERFLAAVRRSWRLHLAVGALAAAAAMAIALGRGSFDLEAPPRDLVDVVFWCLISLDGWCWTLFFLFVGMRWLDRAGPALAYGQRAVLPFFVLHQPVIIVLAFYAVQWQVGLVPKLLFVVPGSLAVTLALYELVVCRLGFLRLAFGMK